MNTDYSTNLTDKQWQVIEKVINPQERTRKHSLRDIMNAILYINKTGCQWRLLPREFGPWQTVYYYFRKWKLEHKFPRLAKILADGGYHGTLGDWVAKKFGWTVEVVLRPDECPTKFPVLPKRWIVERSFSWLENFRRLTIDYEYLADTAEAMVQLAFAQIMLNKFFQ